LEIKKSYKADLERRRPTMFLLGIIVVLASFIVIIEHTTSDGGGYVEDSMIDDLAQDIEMMPELQRNDMVAAAAPADMPKLTGKLNVVDDNVNVDMPAQAEESVQVQQEDGGLGADSPAQALSPVTPSNDDNPLNFRVVEQLPEFPGGMVGFMKWLTANLKYPAIAQQQKIQGKVIVSFIVNKDGSTSDVKVVKSVSPYLDREAVRVMRMMPRWKPGENHGKPCRTMFSVPVVFSL